MTIHWRTDTTLEDRQYIGGKTIHWRTDKTLEDRDYIREQTINIGGQTI
jgi:hypothetical protein